MYCSRVTYICGVNALANKYVNSYIVFGSLKNLRTRNTFKCDKERNLKNLRKYRAILTLQYNVNSKKLSKYRFLEDFNDYVYNSLHK